MKYTLAFAITFVTALISCNQVNTHTDMEKQNKKTYEKFIQQYFEHFNQHDWLKLAELYADTVEMKDPSMGIDLVTMTRADIVKKYTELQQMIPDVKDSIVNVYPSNQHCIVEFISHGTAPDGNTFILPICTIFEFKDDKIIKDFTYYDNF
jgi:ketosteroid isomerase-like protein